MKCRNCNTKIIKFFSLGKLPLGNGFLRAEEISLERKYDLSVGFCPNCYLVQLIKTIPPKKLYRKSFYLQSTFESTTAKNKERARYLIKRLNLSPKSMVLEIGSNDGSQLQFFRKSGLKVLGIEPALNVTEMTNKNNIQTIIEFFNYKFAKKIKKEICCFSFLALRKMKNVNKKLIMLKNRIILAKTIFLRYISIL